MFKLDNKKYTIDIAVSPVLAVILMIGVTIVLSAAIGVLVLEIGQSQSSISDQSNSGFSISDENGEVRIQSQTGNADNVKVLVDGDVKTTEEDVRPGDVITLEDISKGSTITVVEVLGDSESVRGTYTVTSGVFDEVVEFSAPSDVSTVSFARGDGTESNPYVIMNDQQLQAMNADLSAHYILEQNIDASGTREWNNGSGFTPIGNDSTKFTGSLDGQGYTIDSLYINRPSTDDVGLIGIATSESSITNIGVSNVNIVGFNTVGGLVGENYGVVSNTYTTGTIESTIRVGGLIGNNYDGTVESSYSTGNTTSRLTQAGGLVGGNTQNGIVRRSYATGDVHSDGGNVGGLIGWNNGGTIESSYATGTVTGTEWVGGLIGKNDYSGNITTSYARGSVTGDTKVGGLVGINDWSSTIQTSYATGNVTGNTDVGGLVGLNTESTVSASYWDTTTSTQTSSSGSPTTNGIPTTDMNGDTYDSAFETNIINNPAFTGQQNNYPTLTWE